MIDAYPILNSALHATIQACFSLDSIESWVRPSHADFGDYTSPCALSLSKVLKKSPMEIANTLVSSLEQQDLHIVYEGQVIKFIDRFEVKAPGYINVFFSKEYFLYLLLELKMTPRTYGSTKEGLGKFVIVEYSQPNTNKPQHVGHARNNFIGSSLARILSYFGYKVLKSNYVGDIGIHICKSMLMYLKHGNNSLPTKKSDHFVGDYYIMFERESQTNPDLEKEALQLLNLWEQGDPATRELWDKMNTWVYEGWKQTYLDQNVSFDTWEYESSNVNVGKEIVKVALDKGIAHKDPSGAIIADLETFGLPNKVLLRQDGTSLYATKDLQLAVTSYEKYHFDKRLYVVDARQADYFRQIFKILSILGYDWSPCLQHVSYGTVELPEGKMSSRKGLVVNADDVFTNLVNLEKEELLNSKRDIEDIDSTARKVALAAFRYSLLHVDSSQDVVFDMKKAAKFEGNTGPYLVYSYTRAISILHKVNYVDILYPVLTHMPETLQEKESLLLKKIFMFREELHKSAELLSPHYLANYLYELCQTFNSFYVECPILNISDINLKIFRLDITYSFAVIMERGLNLLCIDPVEKM